LQSRAVGDQEHKQLARSKVQMMIPPEFRKDAEALPPALRLLLDAELSAGNTIAEVGSSFPAPPAGAHFKLARQVTTRLRQSGDGLNFRDYGYPNFSGAFTDERGFYFILEPPVPPLPEPDMDAIRAAHSDKWPHPQSADREVDNSATVLGKFCRSMVIDYEKWHDGVGYDLDAIAIATPEERAAIEAILLNRGIKDWRDAEALAALDTPGANEALRAALPHVDAQVRAAIVRCAPKLIANEERTLSLVKALENASLYGGLSQALDEAADFHPKEVMDSLFRGVQHRDGETAVLFAAMLMFVHGKADSAFDWDQRPLFLRFNTQNQAEREMAFAELCEKIGVSPENGLQLPLASGLTIRKVTM
jgi:hypothetical protein